MCFHRKADDRSGGAESECVQAWKALELNGYVQERYVQDVYAQDRYAQNVLT